MKVSERFKLISISLLFIVGLISCSMQASAEAGGSGKIPNRIEGLYLTQLGNSLFYDIFYPDGSYVQLDYEKPLPEREAMLFSMIAGGRCSAPGLPRPMAVAGTTTSSWATAALARTTRHVRPLRDVCTLEPRPLNLDI